MAGWVSRARRRYRPIGSIDGATHRRVTGWAHAPGKVAVEAWIDGERVATCTPSLPRLDVAASLPGRKGAPDSGFLLELPADAIRADGLAEIHILARPSTPFVPPTLLGKLHAVGPDLLARLDRSPEVALRSPFPADVTAVVQSLDPDACADLQTDAGQRRFVGRLARLFATPGINAHPALAGYARYLSATHAHCQFVARHFPAFNPTADEKAADFHCKPNSVHELFPIIHHLYVLRSHGVAGDFAEFGCFKGYSSSMLSFACQQLGLPMHIFDSFAGLPPAEGSGYQAGQYAGSLDEVRGNIARFGALDAVRFHPGFFSHSLQQWRPEQLCCLWMDVDLESSARDLLVVADRVDPRGAIFSHECEAGIFAGEPLASAPRLDNPVAPLLAAFDGLGRPLTGHYVAGYTGAFWSAGQGLPVLRTGPLFELVESLG